MRCYSRTHRVRGFCSHRGKEKWSCQWTHPSQTMGAVFSWVGVCGKIKPPPSKQVPTFECVLTFELRCFDCDWCVARPPGGLNIIHEFNEIVRDVTTVLDRQARRFHQSVHRSQKSLDLRIQSRANFHLLSVSVKSAETFYSTPTCSTL